MRCDGFDYKLEILKYRFNYALVSIRFLLHLSSIKSGPPSLVHPWALRVATISQMSIWKVILLLLKSSSIEVINWQLIEIFAAMQLPKKPEEHLETFFQDLQRLCDIQSSWTAQRLHPFMLSGHLALRTWLSYFPSTVRERACREKGPKALTSLLHRLRAGALAF